LEIQTKLDTALSDEMIAFAEKQDEARKELTDALDDIQAEFEDKLGKITNATKATTAAINAMVTALNAARELAAKPMPTPTAPTVTKSTYDPTQGNTLNSNTFPNTNTPTGNGNTVIVNAPITNNNTTTPSDISATLVKLAKFGLAVG
jgi:hypothetical protein